MSYRNQLERHRAEKDNYLEKYPHSPLPDQERRNFSGLDYYPIDEDYRYVLPLQKYDEVEVLEMETSTGGVREFKRIGYLEFDVDGERAQLNVYQATQNGNHYFIPFRDATSGKETYGAGRYLDPDVHGDRFVLDFNLAYNPYCAYNDYYVCPLPPVENWLDVAIRAGEKDYAQ